MPITIDTTVALLTEAEALEIIGEDADISLVRAMLNAISIHFASITGRNLLLATYTNEYYDGSGTRNLVLRETPVKQVDALYVGINETVALVQGIDKDFMLDKAAGIITLMAGVFPGLPYSVKVTYQAGLETVPHDLKFAAKKAIAFLYSERTRIGISAISTPDQVTTYIEQSYPKQVIEIVQRYRRLLVA